MSRNILLPRLSEIGAGALDRVPSVLKALGIERPLIVTDSMMQTLGYVDRLTSQLEAAGVAHAVFADTVPEPTESSIKAGVSCMTAGLDGGAAFDGLIALGGGSPIDSAKAIGVLGHFGGTSRDYKFPKEADRIGLPMVAIPTTAGTGSEATRFTIVTDDTAGEKMLCVGVGFMPTAAILDYELTLSVPARVTADTGIDALTHAIEAYVSRKANPFSDEQALAAMRLIGPNLRRVYRRPRDRAAREAMMLGAHLAGVAFSNASVALVHGMSRPIGAAFHVPHGMSNAMLLPAVTAYSIEAAPARYAECARAMGVANPLNTDLAAINLLRKELVALNAELNVPTPGDFGIARDDWAAHLDTMAEQALASGSPGNNPRVPDADEIKAIYERSWFADVDA
ncbi:iron-containing alcohol dehydrogenase [Salinisphaera sp. Q1T1-3]|uniref:iron-containing alcohol dehydrogenase n=1 Tax=Salinisphaera sp. Q1T1-3 TaxID=2321229 RepID=UPI000E7606B5|nr:iron-containing alcohol dehydrogenase [Salinisphaera sp. Q1T1-3]RJS95401.1 iron-containing alcohol dehydrogenase [Salinisphaera sp. Q1T1-3]